MNTKLIGYAHTIRFVESGTVNPNPPTQHHVDSAKEGSVIIIQQPDTVNAVWGGLLSTRSKKIGVNGVVVDGRIRDVNEHWELGFPVFARGTSTLSAKKMVELFSMNEELEMGTDKYQVKVRAGDIIVGDLNGVVCCPIELVDQVVELCHKVVTQDEKVKDDLLEGASLREAFKKHRH